MGIEISQYRASIGAFNSTTKKTNKFKTNNKTNQPTKSQPTYNFFSISLVILLPILIGSLAAIYKCDEYQYNEIRKTNLQSNNFSGGVSQDLTSSFLAKFTLNVLAASSFSMISNFQSRYVNGNNKNL